MDNLLTKIQQFIERYVVLPDPESQGIVLALWVIHSWMFSESCPTPYTTGYLYVHSPEKRSGKTRLMEVLTELVRNPVNTANISSAALFRLIESVNPTIMIDEVDAIWSGAKNEDLRGVLNSGYKRSGHVWRAEPGTGEAVQFSTFGPKLFAGIDNGMLPGTVYDRCIPIRMRRRKDGEREVHDFFSFDIADDVEVLTAEISEWVSKNAVKVHELRPKPIEGIGDRQWEITMPMVSIAEVMKVGKAARAAFKVLMSGQDEESLSPQTQLLSDIRDIFNELDVPKLTTNDILERLEGNWTGKLLSEQLKAYGIRPGSIRIKNIVSKGYKRDDFRDAWERYLD